MAVFKKDKFIIWFYLVRAGGGASGATSFFISAKNRTLQRKAPNFGEEI